MIRSQRINAAASRWRAGLGMMPWLFVLGIAVGAILAGNHYRPRHSDESAADAVRREQDAAIWRRAGQAASRHPVEVLRTLDGDTFEARVHLWPGLDMVTRVRLRGIDAPELKARCMEERVKAEAAHAALRALLASLSLQRCLQGAPAVRQQSRREAQ